MNNPFRRKPKLEPRPCEVLIVEDSEYLMLCLGITSNRWSELSAIISEATKTKNTHELIAEVSKACRHPNELAAACFSIGLLHGRRMTFCDTIESMLGK